MNAWNKTAQEQSLYGNTLPTQQPQRSQNLDFKPRKNYAPADSVEKSKGLPEYGHMTFLKKLNQDNQEVVLITSLGYVIRGFVKAVDEQTISLKCPNKGDESSSDGQGYRTRIIFKSQIVELSPVRGIENLADKLEQQGWVSPPETVTQVSNSVNVTHC